MDINQIIQFVTDHWEAISSILVFVVSLLGMTKWGKQYKFLLDLLTHALEQAEAKEGKKAVAEASKDLHPKHRETLEKSIDRARKRSEAELAKRKRNL